MTEGKLETCVSQQLWKRKANTRHVDRYRTWTL